VIGREAAQICLDDPGVSRRHAKLIIAADRSVMIMDLGSTNRTFVNDTIVQLATLMPGDVIRLGKDVVVRFGYTALEPTQCEAVTGEPPLSKRQLEVARLVAQGMTNAEVGRALCISAHTVARHLENIYRRLSVRSRAGLTRWILDAGD
jgi:DNA-binding CsgD family transcriptional regulator